MALEVAETILEGVDQDDEAFETVANLVFANLTAPVLAEMKRPGTIWRTLVDIAKSSKGWGGAWGPYTDAGTLKMSINPSRTVRISVALRNPGGGVGPDEITGRFVDMAGIVLPETVMAAAAGRRIDQIVTKQRLRGILGDQLVTRAEPKAWGVRFALAMPFVQPTREDLLAIRNACTPLT